MKILVTGGAGFIGSHVVDHYISAGHEVIVVDDLSTGKMSNINPKAIFYQLDIRSVQLEEIFERERPDVINHHAAQMDVRRSVADPIFDADVNVLGSINLIECSRKYQVRRFIYISTGGAVYGEPVYLPCDEAHPVDPICPYGASKHTVEHYLYMYQQLYGMEYVVLRYPNVYGPRQDPHGEAGVVAIFAGQMLSGDEVVINGDGNQERDFVFVSDCARANVLALSEDVPRGIYNIGTSKGSTVNEIFAHLKEITGFARDPVHGPAKLGETRRIFLSAERAESEMGWEPSISFKDGLKKTVDFFIAADGSHPEPFKVQRVSPYQVSKAKSLMDRISNGKHFDLLNRIQSELGNGTNDEDLIQMVLELVLEGLGASSGSVFLVDQQHKLVLGKLKYGDSVHTKIKGESLDVLRHGLAGWVLHHQQAALIPSTREDQRWLPRAWDENNDESRSAMSVPLMTGGRRAGVLTVVHSEAHRFSEEEFAILKTVAVLFSLTMGESSWSELETAEAADSELQ
jgi:UDP-glucose 4-epimerase